MAMVPSFHLSPTIHAILNPKLNTKVFTIALLQQIPQIAT